MAFLVQANYGDYCYSYLCLSLKPLACECLNLFQLVLINFVPQIILNSCKKLPHLPLNLFPDTQINFVFQTCSKVCNKLPHLPSQTNSMSKCICKTALPSLTLIRAHFKKNSRSLVYSPSSNYDGCNMKINQKTVNSFCVLSPTFLPALSKQLKISGRVHCSLDHLDARTISYNLYVSTSLITLARQEHFTLISVDSNVQFCLKTLDTIVLQTSWIALLLNLILKSPCTVRNSSPP